MAGGHLITGIGVLLALISLFADPLGIGGEPGFGYKQWAGLIAGIVLVGVGIWWSRARR
jgi:hypothetical protein